MMKSRRIRCAEHVARMGEKMKACRILVGKPEGKRPLGRSRRRWLDNINMDRDKMVWYGMVWIGLISPKRGSSERPF
jgi:hypothetical protein